MEVVRFATAQARAGEAGLGVGLDSEQSALEKRKMELGDSAPRDPRSTVEHQFTQMGEAHDRIRGKFLETHQSKSTDSFGNEA